MLELEIILSVLYMGKKIRHRVFDFPKFTELVSDLAGA